MNAEEKIQKITQELSDIDSCDMTDAELKIREIIEDQKASEEDKKRSKINTSRLS